MLCYSTGSLPVVSFQQIVDILKPTIFKGVELVILPEFLNREKSFWIGILDLFSNNGITIRNIHVGYPFLLSSKAHYPGICEQDKKQRQIKWDTVLKSFEIAEYLKASHLTITSGILNSDFSLESQVKSCYDFFEWIFSSYDGNVKIGLEQEPEHVIHSSEQLLQLCQDFQNQIGANFDIGHSHVLNEHIPKALNDLAPYIYNLHFEDIQERIHQHLLFGQGTVPFLKIQQQLVEMNYLGDYTPDLYPFANEYVKGLESSQVFFNDFLKPLSK